MIGEQKYCLGEQKCWLGEQKCLLINQQQQKLYKNDLFSQLQVLYCPKVAKKHKKFNFDVPSNN